MMLLVCFFFIFSTALRQACSLAGAGRVRQVEEAPRSQSHEGMEWRGTQHCLSPWSPEHFPNARISQKPIFAPSPLWQAVCRAGIWGLVDPKMHACMHACTHSHAHARPFAADTSPSDRAWAGIHLVICGQSMTSFSTASHFFPACFVIYLSCPQGLAQMPPSPTITVDPASTAAQTHAVMYHSDLGPGPASLHAVSGCLMTS